MREVSKAKFLLEIVQPYRYFVLAVILLSVLGSGFDAISVGMLVPLLSSLQNMEGASSVPRVFQWIVHFLKPYPVNQQIFLSLGFIVLAVLAKDLFIALYFRLGHWLSGRLLADLRARAMHLLMSVGIEFHHRSRAGDLIAQTIGNTHYVELLLRTIIEFVANSLTVAALVVMLFILSWQLALLALLLGGVFLLFTLYYAKGLLRLGEERATLEQEMMSTLHESLSGIQLIKTYSREHQQLQSLNQVVEAARQVTYRRNFTVFAIHPITDVWATIAFVLLFVAAMPLYHLNTKLMLTQLFPFIFVLTRIVPLLKLLHSEKANFASYWPYVALVHELLRRDNKTFIPDGEKQFPGLRREIRLQDVTFFYYGRERPALQEISCVIPAGKTTAIIGESGSGKTTIAQLLLRLYDPQQGEITLDGEPLPEFRLETYHDRIGIVSQETFLFNNTIRFNIAYSEVTPPPEERIVEAARQAGAHDFIIELPLGYDTMIGDRGVQLSGGQRQRLAIARAILRDPEILILDEATSSLDMDTERRIHEAIMKLSQGRTVIIITHRLSTVENADQIIVLSNGRIAEVRQPTMKQRA